MDGIIKLFPTQDNNIILNSIVRLKNRNYIVQNIDDNNMVTITPDEIRDISDYNDIIIAKHKLVLMKYYVITRYNIIGELNYLNYSNVIDKCDIKYNTHTIFSKPEVGDRCTIIKYKAINCHGNRSYCKCGTIVDVCGNKAIVECDDGDEILVRRHQYLLENNIKTICTKI